MPEIIKEPNKPAYTIFNYGLITGLIGIPIGGFIYGFYTLIKSFSTDIGLEHIVLAVLTGGAVAGLIFSFIGSIAGQAVYLFHSIKTQRNNGVRKHQG